jgi:two-component system, NarL family, invasion response regulator UvrY
VDGVVRVLVVDDQPLFLTVATTVVERTPGFSVVGQAANGEEAIACIAALAPDLVLMDINMPVLDGIEATRRIGAEWPDVVVILLSSYAKADLPDGVADGGAADYLHKEELAPATLRTLWEQHRPRAGA